MRFLGLGFEDAVPDATTVWLFWQRLLAQGLVEVLFEQFDGYLIGAGYQANQGWLTDKSFLVGWVKQRGTQL
ncbi:MAG: transposase [Synechococcales cyanobacterium T60_A2020_003]|nr:transposase [Synechococcales cyanobacterium T60_A2020_003]